MRDGDLARRYFRCGPLDVEVVGPDCAETERAGLTLDIYTAAWNGGDLFYRISFESGDPCEGMLAGTWLQTGRMHVDQTPEGMHATCQSGLKAFFDRSAGRWDITLPPGPVDIWRLTDVEHLLSLALTTGWRTLGWVPVHAGTVVRDGVCAMLCAASGGGKTTFTTALLRRGWDSLGDDKLLLRCCAGGRPELRALVHSLNLFPHSVRWFPELDGITDLPAYSVWTDKRRVPMEWLRPDSALMQGEPTHIVRVTRSEGGRGIRISDLSAHETLDLLLRQTVIPSDRILAGQIMGTVTRTAQCVRGLAVQVGDDAYDHPDYLDAFEEAVMG